MPNGEKSQTQLDHIVDVVILCIDTEARDTIVNWLESLGVRAFVAERGSEAKKVIRDFPCRMLITDRLLPPWPGLGRIGKISSKRPGLRIAFIDNGNPDGRMLAHAVGATDILPRPLTRRSLVNVLARLDAA